MEEERLRWAHHGRHTATPTTLQPQLKLAQKLLQNNLKIYMCGKNATYMDDNQQINTYENNNNVKITK